MKDRIVVAAIVAGAIIIAIPIGILGVFKVLWDFGISLATPKAPVVAEKMRRLAEAAETRISGRTDKQAKVDIPGESAVP